MRTWKPVDKVGVVVHGPEVIDSGAARIFLDWLKERYHVKSVLGGTMGRVAVIDAGLTDVIDIKNRELPSRSVLDLQSFDLVVLLNEAKTRETGLVFGCEVAARACPTKPLLQVDFGGRFVVELVGRSGLASEAANRFGFELIEDPAICADDSVPEKGIVSDVDVTSKQVRGTVPGEPISVNGTVVGVATGPNVEIVFENGRIVQIKGGKAKRHGIEKLKAIDLASAIIRSGHIRRTSAKNFARESSSFEVKDYKGNGVAFIDHAAEASFETAKGCFVAVTVGDDTTTVAGDILCRLGIPIIGIIDGDRDGVAKDTNVAKGSCIIQVTPGFDDIIGHKVKEYLGSAHGHNGVEELAETIVRLVGEHLVSVRWV